MKQGTRPTAPWLALGVALVVVVVIGIVVFVPRGSLFQFLGREPFTLLFLVMAAGYSLGKVTVKGLSLGASAGSLVVAIALSYWASARHDIRFELPAFASVVFFNLFMFSIGMKVGPQFLSGLDRGARNYILIAVLVPVSAMVLALGLRALIGPPAGAMTGLFAGANTATPGLAAANAAFDSGAVILADGVDRAETIANMSTAFACSYCVSSVVFVVFLKMLPGLFGRDPAAEARAFEREVGGSGAPLPGAASGVLPSSLPVQQRTYRIEKTDLVGESLGQLRSRWPFLAVEHVERAGQSLPVGDDTRLALGDGIRLFARTPLLIDAAKKLGPEIVESAGPLVDLHTVEVVQRNPATVGMTLVEFAKDLGHGLYLNAMFRAGEEMPQGNEVTIKRGDVLRVTGTSARLARVADGLGPVVRQSVSTDLLTLAIGLSIGAVLGAVNLRIGSINFTLGSLAILLVGIALSTLRTRNPTLGGPFPEPARQLLEDLGLNVFVIILGLGSGPGLTRAIEVGAFLPLFATALIVGLVPPLLVWVLGVFALRMNPAELLGAVAGARCSGSALRSAQEVCQSTVPAIAYPVTYALSNLLFTLLTYVLVLME